MMPTVKKIDKKNLDALPRMAPKFFAIVQDRGCEKLCALMDRSITAPLMPVPISHFPTRLADHQPLGGYVA
jgi:hypothetical protein